jgi:esterase/lipase
MGRRSRVAVVAGIVAALLVCLAVLGPRVPHTARVPHPVVDGDVEAWLGRGEAAAGPVTPGTEKAVMWAGSKGQVTRRALVYLHGFTGSRQELSPVLEITAARLGANLFATRYAGHGLGSEAIAGATLQDWVDDTAEGLAVARRLGSRVGVVAMSTAAPLALWLATLSAPPDAIVLLSPNFGPANKSAELLLLPWGNLIVRLAAGPYSEFKVVNERHARYSTPRYRSEALLTMMASVDLGRRAPLESLRLPLLCLYSSRDDVVSLPRMAAAFDRLGCKDKAMVEVKAAGGHVLGGDTHSPGSTDELVGLLTRFFERELRD